jgi:hypothetical protein
VRRHRPISELGLLIAFLLVCFGIGVAPLRAGNPLQTNDPETPGRNGFEVNLSNNLRLTRNEFTQHLPLLDINYGHVENVQWKISIPVLQVDPDPGVGHWGVGDVQLGWKYRFLEEEEHGFMASLYPQPLLPTGNVELGLGDGHFELFLPMSVGKHFWKDQLFVYAEAGHNIVFEDTSQDTWFFGVASEWKLTEKLELVGEIADVVVSQSGGCDELFFNLGFNYQCAKHVALQTAFGRSFGDEGGGLPYFTSYVGLQITWGGESDQSQKSADVFPRRRQPLSAWSPRVDRSGPHG